MHVPRHLPVWKVVLLKGVSWLRIGSQDGVNAVTTKK